MREQTGETPPEAREKLKNIKKAKEDINKIDIIHNLDYTRVLN